MRELLLPVAILLSAVLLAVALRPPRYQFSVAADGLVVRGDTRTGEALLCRPVRPTGSGGYFLGCWTAHDGYNTPHR